MARLQQVGQEPVCIVDTAHNPASIEAGLQALDDHFPGYSLITVFATSRDKDYRLMLRSLMGSARHIVLTAYRDNPRGLPVDELASAAKAVLAELRSDGLEQIGDCPGITVCDSPQAAWERAKSMAGSKDLVLATGSFFLAAELLPLIAE
jgi:dihydrofolate synthase/folylpolyglutamate synthase